MKVAISVPDQIFSAAESLARQMKKSRSELYSDAIAQYVGAHGALAVREQLNAVYATESSPVDPTLAEIQQRTWAKDETW